MRVDETGQAAARVVGCVDGLDVITAGGLPRNRVTLVAGTAGSGKTVFASQFLARGVQDGEPGVFVTFEERPGGLRRDLRSFGWDVQRWQDEGLWTFVDGTPDYAIETNVAGSYDLSPLIARVTAAVSATDAKRVAIDSTGALIAQFETPGPSRRALFQLTSALEDLGVTTILTAERLDDYGPVSQHGFEEFIADNVLILRNPLTGEKRRRTIEVLKMRGAPHIKGEHLFTLRSQEGIVIVPNTAINFDYESSTERVTSGNVDLDGMLMGGLYQGALVLVSGATGTGKSLFATQFIAGGADAGERALFHSFEESPQQIARNALQWGIDIPALERAGRLRLVAHAPEAASLEDHLLRMKKEVDEFQPNRVAIDSLTALQRVSTVTSFRDYVLGLTFHFKKQGILGLMTATSSGLDPEISLSDLHISTITDAIITLRYVGVDAEVRRGVNVLKLRGSDHDKALREFNIDDSGLHIRGAFRGLTGSHVPTNADGADPTPAP